MNRRETLRLLSYLGIKSFPPCTAQQSDICAWSSFSRNIGRRLANCHEHMLDDDLYISYKMRAIFKEEYVRRINKKKSVVLHEPNGIADLNMGTISFN